MKYLRSKHIRKSLRQYQFLCGIKAPYKIILDCNFIAMCTLMKVDLLERLPKFLQTTECTYFVTQSGLDELKAVKDMEEAYKVALQFPILFVKTKKTKEVAQVTTDILTLIGPLNKKQYFVATQELELRKKLRLIPGVPILYLNRSVLVFEDVSPATLRRSRTEELTKLKLKKEEQEKVNLAYRNKMVSNDMRNKGEQDTSASGGGLQRKRAAKGPNPLSCKPRMKKRTRT